MGLARPVFFLPRHDAEDLHLQLHLTDTHWLSCLFRESSTGSIESVYASQLVEGDRLVRPKMEGKHDLDEVLAIQTVSEEIGYWAPLTQDGTLLVNGLLVS